MTNKYSKYVPSFEIFYKMLHYSKFNAKWRQHRALWSRFTASDSLVQTVTVRGLDDDRKGTNVIMEFSPPKP